MSLNVRHIRGESKEKVENEIVRFIQKYGYRLVDTTWNKAPWEEGWGVSAMITYTK